MLFAPLFILIVIYINVYGIKLMKRATDPPSSGVATATEVEEGGGKPPPFSPTTKPAILAEGNSSGMNSSVPQANKQSLGTFATMEEHMALKDEVDRIRQMLNKYESVWGWEKPFK